MIAGNIAVNILYLSASTKTHGILGSTLLGRELNDKYVCAYHRLVRLIRETLISRLRVIIPLFSLG